MENTTKIVIVKVNYNSNLFINIKYKAKTIVKTDNNGQLRSGFM